jgi:hypothetical protein
MRFNPENLTALGTLIFGGLVAMKVKRKVLGWALMSIAAIVLIAMIFWPDNESKTSDDHKITLTTYGNNSPAAVTIGSN